MFARRPRLIASTMAATLVAISALAAVHPSIRARAAGAGGAYTPLAPARILDTRVPPGHALGPAATMAITVAGMGGVPANATAVVMNVTISNATAESYLTVYPTGTARPVTSNLNWKSDVFAIANLVQVGLGTGGQVSVYNAAGSVDVIFDVAGYVSTGLPAGAGLYQPLVPARILDTRDGTGMGGAAAPLAWKTSLTLQVSGHGGVPATGAAAVVLNLTVTGPTSNHGYLTVFPADQVKPMASNLNWSAGATIANRVVVGLNALGQVTIVGNGDDSANGHADVIADVGGWFTDSNNSAATGSSFVPLTPARILDTRDGTGGFPVSSIGPQQAIPVQVAGRGGVPLMTDPQPPNAVVANVTATGGTNASYATIWPDGATRPVASDLNWGKAVTIPNLVVVGLGGSGIADLFNAAGCTHVVVDVVGYYTGPPLAPAAAALTRAPICPPAPRTGASLAYDAATQKVVMFGGATAGGVTDETWTWDGVKWSEHTVRPGPPARIHASIAYDAATQTVVMFSGSTGNPNLPLLDDTWTWDGMTWTPKNPATSPPSVEREPMAYDAARGKVVLVAQPPPYSANATWTWDGVNWTQQHPLAEPPVNIDPSMAYDSTRSRIVIFGGWRNTIAQADTWTWDGSNWTDVTPATTPSGRYDVGLADDPVLHQVLLFGGLGSLTDTWTWNGTSWVQLHPASSPLAMNDGGMVGDPAANVVLLFCGGTVAGAAPGTPGTCTPGTWTWDGTTWTARE